MIEDLVRAVAIENPGATLPCPACAATFKGTNLDAHLKKVHGGALPGSSSTWQAKRRITRLPVTVALTSTSLTVGRRVVALPAALVAGGLERAVSSGSSTGDQGFSINEIVKAGTYLQVGKVRLGCRTGPSVAKSWVGTSPGKRSRHWKATLRHDDWVALQYALASLGFLELRR